MSTRDPITLQGGANDVFLYVENRHLYETATIDRFICDHIGSNDPSIKQHIDEMQWLICPGTGG